MSSEVYDSIASIVNIIHLVTSDSHNINTVLLNPIALILTIGKTVLSVDIVPIKI